MITKLKHLYNSEGINQTVITGFSNYTSAILAAFAIIFISRNLGPTIFGEFSAAFSLATVLAKLNDAGITIATQKFASKSTNKREVKSIVLYGYRLKMLLSSILMVLVLPLSGYLTHIFSFSHPAIVPISISLGLFLVYNDQLIASLLATHSFLKAAYANILQAGLKLIAAIVITFKLDNALLPLLISYLLAPGIPVIFKSLFEPAWFKKTKPIKISSKNKQKFLSLAKHSALLVFVLGILDSVGVLFVKAYLSSYEAGLLGGISRVAMLFIMIGVSISQVLNNRVSRYTDKHNLKIYLNKILYLSGASIMLFLLTLPLLPLIIRYTIGTEYLVALVPMILLLASVFVYILSVPFAALFYSFEKNSYFSISGFIQLTSIILGNLLLVPSFGITGSALAQLFSRSILLVFTLFFAYRAYREKFGYEK